MMLAVAAVAGLAFADGVQSSNIVGYRNEDLTEYRYLSVQFSSVGVDGEFDFMDIVDVSQIVEDQDELLVYSSELGADITYLWSGSEWYNPITTDVASLQVVPGNVFCIMAENPWTISGQVPDVTVPYEHQLTAGEYCYVGSAFPVDAVIADYDWSNIVEDQDELALYDSVEGVDVTYLWNGSNWYHPLLGTELPSDYPLTDGFMIMAESDTLRQSLSAD